MSINSLVFMVIFVLVLIVVFKFFRSQIKPKKSNTVKASVSVTEKEQINQKIASLKNQAKDRNIYEKSLKILSFFNKDKDVRTYFLFMGEDNLAKKETEEMEKAGIITYENKKLIIKKEQLRLSIINKDEQGDKTVFEWLGGLHPDHGTYRGLGVCSYIPGVWEKDIDQLFTKIQEEEKELKELTEKQQEKKEGERWGL